MKFKTILALFINSLWMSNAVANPLQNSLDGPIKANLNLYVFAADISGDIGAGPITYDVDQSFSDTLEHLDKSYMGHFDLSKGKWGAYVDYQSVQTSQKQSVLQLPVALSTDLDQTSFGVYYQAYTSDKSTKNGYSKFIVEPTIGVHHTKAAANLSALGKNIDLNKSWNEIFWGSRFKYNFESPFNLASEITFGQEGTISAQTYLGYRLGFFDRDFNLRMGYRYLEQDYRSDNFHWKVKEYGPVIGLNLPLF